MKAENHWFTNKKHVMQTNTLSLDLSRNMIVYVMCENKKANILQQCLGTRYGIKVMVEFKKIK